MVAKKSGVITTATTQHSLLPQAIPETGTLKEAFEARAKVSEMTSEQFQESLASKTHARRLMTLAEMANVAVFTGFR